MSRASSLFFLALKALQIFTKPSLYHLTASRNPEFSNWGRREQVIEVFRLGNLKSGKFWAVCALSCDPQRWLVARNKVLPNSSESQKEIYDP